MKIETSHKTIPQVIFAGVHKFTFSLYTHKRESDRANKHVEWSAQKHIALTTLAILIDMGFNATVAMLAFSGNLWEAASLKLVHSIGSAKAPQVITNLKNDLKSKIINRN